MFSLNHIINIHVLFEVHYSLRLIFFGLLQMMFLGSLEYSNDESPNIRRVNCGTTVSNVSRPLIK